MQVTTCCQICFLFC